MPDTQTPSVSRPPSRPQSREGRRGLRPWHAVVVVAPIILAVAVYFINAHWPFRYRVVKPLMEDVLASQVAVTRYHRTYFPHPGFVATGLTLHRKSASGATPPLGSAETVVVEGRWSDLLMLRQQVRLVDITSLHVVLPPPGSSALHEDFPPGSASDFTGPDTLIQQLRIHNAVLDIMRTNGDRYSFPIAELEVRDFQKGRANTFAVDMQNAKPRGRILARGDFGPFNAKYLAATPVSGTFTFTSVRLPDVGNISGTLSSAGRFTGALGSLETSATSKTPDFAVDGGRPTPVSGDIQCNVNGVTGEVVIHTVAVRSGETTVTARGAIQGSPKTTNLDFVLENGRAQDAMRPFMHRTVPITGRVRLRGHAYVAPVQPGVGFLQRLKVNGVFAVPAEHLTDRDTEKSLTEFSQRAQAKKPDQHGDDSPSESDSDAVSSLEGPVSIRDGIAASQHLTFVVAGARAELQGTFNFHNQNVHLLGNMAMQSDISHATTGFKSFLLKPLAPFLRKKHAGAVVPIAVTGAPGHYKVTSDFLHNK